MNQNTSKQIRTNNYGIITISSLYLKKNKQLNDIVLYISEPLEQVKIKSIEFINDKLF